MIHVYNRKNLIFVFIVATTWSSLEALCVSKSHTHYKILDAIIHPFKYIYSRWFCPIKMTVTNCELRNWFLLILHITMQMLLLCNVCVKIGEIISGWPWLCGVMYTCKIFPWTASGVNCDLWRVGTAEITELLLKTVFKQPHLIMTSQCSTFAHRQWYASMINLTNQDLKIKVFNKGFNNSYLEI